MRAPTAHSYNADFVITDDQVKNALIKVYGNNKEQKILSSYLGRNKFWLKSVSCRGDLDVENFRCLKTKSKASKTTHGMHCSLVLYTEFSVISSWYIIDLFNISFDLKIYVGREGGLKLP